MYNCIACSNLTLPAKFSSIYFKNCNSKSKQSKKDTQSKRIQHTGYTIAGLIESFNINWNDI